MKSLKSSSIFTANNSIPLIIFIFIFLGVGMFYFIQKTTEKNNQDKLEKQNRIVEEKNILNTPTEKMSNSSPENMEISGVENTNNNDSLNTDYNTVTETFKDEVGLFIKKDETRPEMYSHNPVYIPPFNTGKETRCVTRHVNRPNETNVVQSCLNSELVKSSSDASF
jgi:uncharacterized membrane protein